MKSLFKDKTFVAAISALTATLVVSGYTHITKRGQVIRRTWQYKLSQARSTFADRAAQRSAYAEACREEEEANLSLLEKARQRMAEAKAERAEKKRAKQEAKLAKREAKLAKQDDEVKKSAKKAQKSANIDDSNIAGEKAA